jgi:hypothetical protein
VRPQPVALRMMGWLIFALACVVGGFVLLAVLAVFAVMIGE